MNSKTVFLVVAAAFGLSVAGCLAGADADGFNAASEDVDEAASAICRDLHAGDMWYPKWVKCCDNAEGTRSYWVHRMDIGNGWWDGSCATWGINP